MPLRGSDQGWAKVIKIIKKSFFCDIDGGYLFIFFFFLTNMACDFFTFVFVPDFLWLASVTFLSLFCFNGFYFFFPGLRNFNANSKAI